MTIDWLAFTPWRSLAGGLLIGSAAAMLLLLNGRLAGISGILGGVLTRAPSGMRWRLAFLMGLLSAPLAFRLVTALPVLEIDADGARLVIAGLLVGYGTRYGSGCTSGHGVCGMGRGSLRSFVATCCFMVAGFATVWALRHLHFLNGH